MTGVVPDGCMNKQHPGKHEDIYTDTHEVSRKFSNELVSSLNVLHTCVRACLQGSKLRPPTEKQRIETVQRPSPRAAAIEYIKTRRLTPLPPLVCMSVSINTVVRYTRIRLLPLHLVAFPGALRHRTQVDVDLKIAFIGDGKMVYAEQMVSAAMTVALSLSVCGDSWFILGAVIAHAPQVYSPTQTQSLVSLSVEISPVKPATCIAFVTMLELCFCMLVIGDSVTHKVRLHTPAELICSPGARAPDIEANFRVLAMRGNDERYRRLMSQHRWLAQIEQGPGFVDNWPSLWGRPATASWRFIVHLHLLVLWHCPAPSRGVKPAGEGNRKSAKNLIVISATSSELRGYPTPNNINKLEELKIGFMNIRSLSTQALLVQDLVVENRIDILGLCETWLKPDVYLPIKMQSYPTQLFYRPPGPYSLSVDELSEFADDLVTYSDNVSLIGDFNIHVNNPSDSLAKVCLSITDMFGFKQLVQHPTTTPLIQHITYTTSLIIRRVHNSALRTVLYGGIILPTRPTTHSSSIRRAPACSGVLVSEFTSLNPSPSLAVYPTSTTTTTTIIISRPVEGNKEEWDTKLVLC
ncbi:hypothetical protein N1851_027105 [Merluccius polli]|uniref:Endonuclease/exonuclease/phosphatase domain-containing protein n=1 Tax=Merluccius polli TaxID=89951 RepID=A0AA47MAJ6_MERPO|nr:hypothetical protein N1851_027105 [Merluccius polli]